MRQTLTSNGPTWEAVFSYMEQGSSIVGIDEVGRGAWAGPVVAAAVLLPAGLQLEGLNDSKLLTSNQRSRLDHIIRRHAVAIGIGWVSPALVDSRGLSWAVKLSGLRALAATALNLSDCYVALDGNHNYLDGIQASFALPKADALITPVAAASVVAKVARDNYMKALARKHPGYHLARHKGYGTKVHLEALASLGPSPIHRLSYRPVKAFA